MTTHNFSRSTAVHKACLTACSAAYSGLANGHSGQQPANGHANGYTNGLHPPGDEEEDHVKLEPAPKPKKIERTAYGLALYALSSCFLATMLLFAKKLGAPRPSAPMLSTGSDRRPSEQCTARSDGHSAFSGPSAGGCCWPCCSACRGRRHVLL